MPVPSVSRSFIATAALAALALTGAKAKMLLTPTYHVFKMYVPFQDATFVPVTLDAGTYKHGEISLPRVNALAARDASGTGVAGADEPGSR